MQFDPSNKIVQLCTEGMNAAATGRPDTAHDLFLQAWELADNDFDALTAAHFLARHQPSQEDTLKWHLEALHRAAAINNETILSFYPSLYLNVAKAHEDLNNLPAAIQHYQLAASYSQHLPEGAYSDMIKTGISNGLKRTGITSFNPPVLEKLVDHWCETKQLQALSFVLPVYLSNLGTPDHVNKLISALSYLSATRCLPASEQEQVDQLVTTLSDTAH